MPPKCTCILVNRIINQELTITSATCPVHKTDQIKKANKDANSKPSNKDQTGKEE